MTEGMSRRRTNTSTVNARFVGCAVEPKGGDEEGGVTGGWCTQVAHNQLEGGLYVCERAVPHARPGEREQHAATRVRRPAVHGLGAAARAHQGPRVPRAHGQAGLSHGRPPQPCLQEEPPSLHPLHPPTSVVL